MTLGLADVLGDACVLGFAGLWGPGTCSAACTESVTTAKPMMISNSFVFTTVLLGGLYFAVMQEVISVDEQEAVGRTFFWNHDADRVTI